MSVSLSDFPEVVAAYEGRAYHNREHLNECLAWCELVPLPPDQVTLLQLALIYHDAIYDPQRSDNERASADWALRDGHGQQVERLILATCHDHSADGLAAWMVDIDLSILGSSPERFARYDLDIRREYAWVPAEVYRLRRAEVLRGFLERPAVYATEWFRERLEATARANLQGALERLADGPIPDSG